MFFVSVSTRGSPSVLSAEIRSRRVTQHFPRTVYANSTLIISRLISIKCETGSVVKCLNTRIKDQEVASLNPKSGRDFYYHIPPQWQWRNVFFTKFSRNSVTEYVACCPSCNSVLCSLSLCVFSIFCGCVLNKSDIYSAHSFWCLLFLTMFESHNLT